MSIRENQVLANDQISFLGVDGLVSTTRFLPTLQNLNEMLWTL